MVYYLLSAFPRCKHTYSLFHLTASEQVKEAVLEASWQEFSIPWPATGCMLLGMVIHVFVPLSPLTFVCFSFLFQATAFPILCECTTPRTVEAWSCLGFLTTSVMQIIAVILQSSLSSRSPPQASLINFSEKNAAIWSFIGVKKKLQANSGRYVSVEWNTQQQFSSVYSHEHW